MTKKLFLLLFLSVTVCTGLPAQEADSTRGTSALCFNMHYGFLIAHRPTVYHLQSSHAFALELNYIKTSDGKKQWQQIFKNPDIGLSLCYINIGNSQHIGTIAGIYPFIDFPLVPSENISFNFRLGWGLGYVQKPFSQYENYKDNAIGSYLNAMINLRFMLQASLGKSATANAALGLTHLSNGSFKTPNLGLNIATVSVGVTKYFGNRSKIQNDFSVPFKKHHDWEIYFGGFSKQIYPALGDNYFAGTLAGNYKFHVSPKSEWVAGADLFFDNSIKTKLENNDAYQNPIDAMRAGLHGGYHLTVGSFTTGFEIGAYVYDKWKEDGLIYNRIVVNQKVSKHLFVCLNLKTHYAKADYIELGMGIRK